MQGFISGNIRIFLILEQESSICKNIKNFFGVNFFVFFGLGLGNAPVAVIYTTDQHSKS